jgi:hypothetical protein
MKRIVFVLTLILALALPSAALADITSYTSGFQLQNLEATSADVTIHFIRQSDGTEQTSVTDTIAASSSKTYYPLSAVATGFNGSVVVDSTTQIAAIVNVLDGTGAFGASYDGFSGGASTINIPLVMRNNYGINTWLNVQNVGSANTNVTITYFAGCTDSVTGLKPGAAHTFDQATTACLTPTPFAGAAVVTSSGSVPVAVTVIQVTGSSSGLKPSLLAYNGFSSASAKPAFPLVTSGYYKSATGIQIMNTGASATNVTVTYKPSTGFPGATCTETKAIAAGKSTTFGFPTMPTACYTNAGGSAGSAAFVGGAAVTTNSASMPLVGVVNQLTTGTSAAGAYGAFDPALATSKVSLPLLMDRNYGIFTGFSVANVGTSSTNVACTFSGGAGAPPAVPSTAVAAGASLTVTQLNKATTVPYVGSASCTATGGDAKIVAVVNELNTGSVIATQDGLSVYEGINY